MWKCQPCRLLFYTTPTKEHHYPTPNDRRAEFLVAGGQRTNGTRWNLHQSRTTLEWMTIAAPGRAKHIQTAREMAYQLMSTGLHVVTGLGAGASPGGGGNAKTGAWGRGPGVMTPVLRFSIRLGLYFIPQHNPIDPLFLQKKSICLYHI